MSAIPEANPDAVMRPILLTGERPNPAEPPSGCRFHTRCRYADGQCRTAVPPLKEMAPGHFAACHYAERLELKGALEFGTTPESRAPSDPGPGDP